MSNGKKRLKVAVLMFAMLFVVGTAFAATNGMLVFGGTVRINNAGSTNARLEFSHADMSWKTVEDWGSMWAGCAGLGTMQFGLTVENTTQFLNDASFTTIPFSFRNTGNVPVRFTEMGQSSHGPRLPILIRDPITGVFGDSWDLGVLAPGQTVHGRIDFCERFFQESDHFRNYIEGGWLSFYYSLTLQYEQTN